MIMKLSDQDLDDVLDKGSGNGDNDYAEEDFEEDNVTQPKDPSTKSAPSHEDFKHVTT